MRVLAARLRLEFGGSHFFLGSSFEGVRDVFVSILSRDSRFKDQCSRFRVHSIRAKYTVPTIGMRDSRLGVWTNI